MEVNGQYSKLYILIISKINPEMPTQNEHIYNF